MGSNPIFSAILRINRSLQCRGIAQLVEQRSPKPRAEGSSPSAPAKHRPQKWLIQAVSEDFPLYFLFCRIMNSAFFYHFSITLVFGWCLEYCL